MKQPWSDPNKGWVSDKLLMGMHPDKGCKYSPKCLDCPFKVCFEDLSHSVKMKLGKLNKEEIREELLSYALPNAPQPKSRRVKV